MNVSIESMLAISAEEQVRAQFYQLMARLFGAAADDDLLFLLRQLDGDESALGMALNELALMAQNSGLEDAIDEYNDLFIGVTHGELVPYKSFYLTGFLNEKPLAELRGDMDQLGIARTAESFEPEDHIASLCEMMQGLIIGAFGKPASLSEQYRFFNAHIGCWAPKLFSDLESANSAHLFKQIGRVGSSFLDIEIEAFSIAA